MVYCIQCFLLQDLLGRLHINFYIFSHFEFVAFHKTHRVL